MRDQCVSIKTTFRYFANEINKQILGTVLSLAGRALKVESTNLLCHCCL